MDDLKKYPASLSVQPKAVVLLYAAIRGGWTSAPIVVDVFSSQKAADDNIQARLDQPGNLLIFHTQTMVVRDA